MSTRDPLRAHIPLHTFLQKIPHDLTSITKVDLGGVDTSIMCKCPSWCWYQLWMMFCVIISLCVLIRLKNSACSFGKRFTAAKNHRTLFPQDF